MFDLGARASLAAVAPMVLMAIGCDDPPPRSMDCLLSDGSFLSAGESPGGGSCLVCEPMSGELKLVFGRCVEIQRVEGVLPDLTRSRVMRLGPDADGDGVGDAVMAGGVEDWLDSRGYAAVVSSASGEELLVVRGEEQNQLLGVSGWQRHAVLGPDVDGDGLAELIVSSGNAVFDVDFITDYEDGAPNPGVVELWSPAGSALVREWRGERDGCSLGAAVDLLPDLDGDGRAEVVIVEGGCVSFTGPPEDRRIDSTGPDRLEVRSGAIDELLWVHAPPPDAYLGVADARVARLPGAPGVQWRIVYERGRGYPLSSELRWEPTLVHLSPSGEIVGEWVNEPSGPIVSNVRPWNLGFDMDGDGVEDAVGESRSSDPGVQLYPSMRRPVGRLTTYSDCSAFPHIGHFVVPDLDADGYPDVFVKCLGGQPAMAFIGGRSARVLWSQTLDETEGEWAVSDPFDIDGDGCADVGAYQAATSTMVIVRCVGS